MDNLAERIIVSGGGSGGHVFPAIAIATALKKKYPQVEILFVGASGKIEMEKVPQAGFEIKGLWISGLQRSLTWRNILFPIKLFYSLWQANRILKQFRPQVTVGVGGYASVPVLYMASRKGIPTLIHEQNSYAGLANRWLAKKVDKICVAYEGVNRFFPSEKVVMTGNPVRQQLIASGSVNKARSYFGLQDNLATVFVVGGSLGAKTFNEVMANGFSSIASRVDVQWIWQIGKNYADKYEGSQTAKLPHVAAKIFIDRMDLAYLASDLVVCRAGALTIAEICAVGKPSILVPSPNVAEDHQRVNAQALLEHHAAEMVDDHKAPLELLDTVYKLIHDKEKLKSLASTAKSHSRPEAINNIVEEILKLIKRNH